MNLIAQALMQDRLRMMRAPHVTGVAAGHQSRSTNRCVRRLMLHSLAALSIALGSPALAESKPEHLYGPAPEWEQFRQIAEANILSQLIDPESARITWLGGYYKGDFKVILGPRTHGYVSCGMVNAKNRMGGYVGNTTFAVVIDYGRVLFVELDSRPGGSMNIECAQLKRDGRLPPVPTDEAAGEAPATLSGLTLRPMPEGAYVTAVAASSAAALAGLKPGMVISNVNAIPLAGMNEGMLKVIEAAGTNATLTVVGGSTFKLGDAS